MLEAMSVATIQAATDEQHWGALIVRMASGDLSAMAEFCDASCCQVYGLAMKVLAGRQAAEGVPASQKEGLWS